MLEKPRDFPPAPLDSAPATLANWRQPPSNKWSFRSVREIVPSADIPNDPDDVWTLPAAPADLEVVRVHDDGTELDWAAFLAKTDTDGLVVLHRGRLAGEFYANGLQRNSPHILMSVSKSLLGLMAGILAERGTLDLNATATHYIPELSGTAYDGASVRDLLDMRAGVLFDEDYLATSGPIIEYRKAQGWDALPVGEAPSDLHSFYKSMTASDGTHRGRFHYVSPNTDLLGWIMERAARARYADLVSAALWQPMGAARSAYITVDRLGAPRCAGGVCTTTQDLARLGQLVLQRGRRGSRQIVPEAWIADIFEHGDPQAWDEGDFAQYFPGAPMHYRSKWYVERGAAPLAFCVSVFGQNVFVDPANEIVIAKFSSQPAPLAADSIALTMRGVAAIRQHLAGT